MSLAGGIAEDLSACKGDEAGGTTEDLFPRKGDMTKESAKTNPRGYDQGESTESTDVEDMTKESLKKSTRSSWVRLITPAGISADPEPG